MVWRRQVRCSYCGAAGHNRLGCPERKKLAAWREKNVSGKRGLRIGDALIVLATTAEARSITTVVAASY